METPTYRAIIFVFAFTVAALILPLRPAKAGFVNGSTLYKLCTSSDPGENKACEYFIAGIADGMESTQAEEGGKAVACWGRDVTLDQLKKIAENYLASHPEDWQYSGGVGPALSAAFPCSH